jgi:hypothetical protein
MQAAVQLRVLGAGLAADVWTRALRGGSSKPRPRMCSTAASTGPWYTTVPRCMIMTSSKSAYVSGGGCSSETSAVCCRLFTIARSQRVTLKSVAASCAPMRDVDSARLHAMRAVCSATCMCSRSLTLSCTC